MTSLSRAILDNRLEEAYHRIANGEDVNPTDNQGNKSPLASASTRGLTDLVRTLIKKGADVNWQSKEGCCAIYFAAANGHNFIVKDLLDAGADIHATNYNKYSALSVALVQNKLKTAELLLYRGAKFGIYDKYMVRDPDTWQHLQTIQCWNRRRTLLEYRYA
jgi:ankyrin repeat protein